MPALESSTIAGSPACRTPRSDMDLLAVADVNELSWRCEPRPLILLGACGVGDARKRDDEDDQHDMRRCLQKSTGHASQCRQTTSPSPASERPADRSVCDPNNR